MTKLLASIAFVCVVVFGSAGARAAGPLCSKFCTCHSNCDDPCLRQLNTPPFITCGMFGKCAGHCAADEPKEQTPLEALTHFVAQPKLACVAGDDLTCGL